MLDHGDEQLIKEAKAGGAVLVTWDRVVRLAAGGMTPYEALDQAIAAGNGTREAQAEVSRLRALKPRELSALMDAADKAYEHFRRHILIDRNVAASIREKRVDQDYSWRAVARYWSKQVRGDWGGNQMAGMVICEKAAQWLGEDFIQPPWN